MTLEEFITALDKNIQALDNGTDPAAVCAALMELYFTVTDAIEVERHEAIGAVLTIARSRWGIDDAEVRKLANDAISSELKSEDMRRRTLVVVS